MKKLLYVVVALVVIYLVLGLIGPKHIHVFRSTEINRDKSLVSEKLKDLQFFHSEWSPWTEKDPNMAKEFLKNPGEVGHQLSWNSKVEEVGQGTLTMVSYPQDSIIQALSFEGMGVTTTYYALSSNKENSTTVTWGMRFDVGFFQRAIMLFMNFDKMMAPDFEKGLSNLKTKIEALPTAVAQAEYKVEELNWEATSFVGKKATVTFAEIGSFFAKEFPALYMAVEKAKIAPLAPPTALITKYDEANQKMDVATVFKVAKDTKLQGYEVFNFDASKVLKVAYYGAYEKTQPAHMAIDAYMKEKKLTNGAVFEEYVTDPQVEKDTTKWLTNIYYMVK